MCRMKSLDRLAEETGLNRDTINRLENLKRGADPITIRKLAQALDVSPNDLYD